MSELDKKLTKSQGSNEDVDAVEWADRLWKLSYAVTLDANHRALARTLESIVSEDAEQAAYLIAVLVQLGEI